MFQLAALPPANVLPPLNGLAVAIPADTPEMAVYGASGGAAFETLLAAKLDPAAVMNEPPVEKTAMPDGNILPPSLPVALPAAVLPLLPKEQLSALREAVAGRSVMQPVGTLVQSATSPSVTAIVSAGHATARSDVAAPQLISAKTPFTAVVHTQAPPATIALPVQKQARPLASGAEREPKIAAVVAAKVKPTEAEPLAPMPEDQQQPEAAADDVTQPTMPVIAQPVLPQISLAPPAPQPSRIAAGRPADPPRIAAENLPPPRSALAASVTNIHAQMPRQHDSAADIPAKTIVETARSPLPAPPPRAIDALPVADVVPSASMLVPGLETPVVHLTIAAVFQAASPARRPPLQASVPITFTPLDNPPDQPPPSVPSLRQPVALSTPAALSSRLEAIAQTVRPAASAAPPKQPDLPPQLLAPETSVAPSFTPLQSANMVPIDQIVPLSVAALTNPPHDFAALVDVLVRSREASSPRPVHLAMAHSEFGQVSLRFAADDSGLSVAMASPDPAFANAVQASLPTDRALVNSETSTTSRHQSSSEGRSSERQSGDSRPRPNPGSETRPQPRSEPRTGRSDPGKDEIFA